jgi:hypothetical protein
MPTVEKITTFVFFGADFNVNRALAYLSLKDGVYLKDQTPHENPEALDKDYYEEYNDFNEAKELLQLVNLSEQFSILNYNSDSHDCEKHVLTFKMDTSLEGVAEFFRQDMDGVKAEFKEAMMKLGQIPVDPKLDSRAVVEWW